MVYIAKTFESCQTTPYNLFVLPYQEGWRNLTELSKQHNAADTALHVLAGILLLIPIINTVVFLILREVTRERGVASLYRPIQAISSTRLHDLPTVPLLLMCSFLPLSDIKALRGVNKKLRLQGDRAIIQRAQLYGYLETDLKGSREHLKMLYRGLRVLGTARDNPRWIKKKPRQSTRIFNFEWRRGSGIDYHATLEYLRLKRGDTIDQPTTDWISYMSDQDDRYMRFVANGDRYEATLLSLCFGLDPKKYPHILTSQALIRVENGILQYIDAKTISLLIAYGADPLHSNEKRESLWSILCKSQITGEAYPLFELVCKIAYEKGVIDDKIDDRITPLMLAIYDDGINPLRLAIYNNDVEKFHILIQQRADPNKETNGRPHLFSLINPKRIKMLKLLLESKTVDINESEWLFHTPLTMAISRGEVEIVRCLLEGGADPNKKNLFGSSSLYYACDRCGQDASHDQGADSGCTILKLLLKHGATINAAYRNVPTLVGFLEAGPNPFTKIEVSREEWHKRRLPFFKLLCENGVDINAQEDVFKNSPLHIAYSNPALNSFIPILTDFGADPELLNAEKKKPYECTPRNKK